MSPRAKLRNASAAALLLLLVSGAVAGFLIFRFMRSESLVIHTLEVQKALGDVMSANSRLGRARVGFVTSGDQEYARSFDLAKVDPEKQIQQILDLTRDNLTQQTLVKRLIEITSQRTSLLQKSMDLKQASPGDSEGQNQITQQGVAISAETAEVMQQMRDEEERLLELRVVRAHRLLGISALTLTITFLLAVLFLVLHDRFLARELYARQRAEREVTLRNMQLEVTNQELETFSYSVSHDLRTPLRAIDGFASILQDSLDGRLNPEEAGHFQDVRDAAARMDHLIRDLLALARASRQQMVRQDVDLTQAAEEIALHLRASDAARSVTFDVAPQMRVQGDPLLLRVALENLMGNAWKFTAKDSDARIEVGTEGTAQGSAYFVRDNGVGFDMTRADKLFGPFQRLHSQSDFPGTGIGLASVKRIIHRHGGRVWAESSPGNGATFYFVLEPAA